MAKEFLDDPEVGAAVEQMGRERVAEGVGADPARGARLGAEGR